jgi:hypoxanthine phosphoribosyltransferase
MSIWISLSIIGGIIGGIVGIEYMVRRIIESLKSRKTVSWGKFVKLIRLTMQEMKEKQYIPDLIIGCGRGGGIMASVLSGNLGVPGGRKEFHVPFITCDRIYTWEQGQRSTCIVRIPQVDFSTKTNILLTIAVVNTGETINTLKNEIIRQAGSKTPSIKVYAVIKYHDSNLTPDFYNIESKELLKMPWEITKEYIHDSKPPRVT